MPPRYRTARQGSQFRAFAECSCGRIVTTKSINRHIRDNPGHYEVRRFERSKDLLLKEASQ